jgi:glutathione peroxidase
MSQSVHDFTLNSIAGDPVSLADYKGKALLIVNVASACGLTPQYEGLEAMQKELGPQGFEVLGFPCNQFGAQEPGTESEIATFCETSFGVTFPMFSKLEVNGDGTAPLYMHLKSATKDASGKDDIAWNFTKFLVDGSGAVVKRFEPMTTPEEITPEVVAILG